MELPDRQRLEQLAAVKRMSLSQYLRMVLCEYLDGLPDATVAAKAIADGIADAT